MSGSISSTGPLQNQLGMGTIPAAKENELRERGIRFASYITRPDGSRFLVTSCHPNIYQRLAEQLQRLGDEERGLPVEYRIPLTASVPA